MSLWRLDRVLAWLSPAGVVVARARRGWRSDAVLAARSRMASEARPTRDWSACCALLEDELRAARGGGAALNVCVSDHFVRYALLGWRQGLRGAAEWEAYARHELEARYGAGATAWTVRLDAGRPMHSRLAAAVDSDLIAALRAIAARAKLRLAALEPNLCRVANRFRRALGQGAVALAVAEPGRVSVLQALDDRWVELDSAREGVRPGEALTSMLLRSRLRIDKPCSAVVLWGERHGDLAELARHGIAVRTPQRPHDVPPACLALGLC